MCDAWCLGAISGAGMATGAFTLALLLRWTYTWLQHRRKNRTYATMVEAEHAASHTPTNRVLSPATCQWQPTGKYACFLSHYKGNSEARRD